MKVAGALIVVVGCLLATVIGLWPTSVSVLGSDMSCGPPVLSAFVEPFDSDDDALGVNSALNEECRTQSWVRLGISGVLGLGALGAGSLMLFLSPSREDLERRRFENYERWQRDQRSRQGPPPHQR